MERRRSSPKTPGRPPEDPPGDPPETPRRLPPRQGRGGELKEGGGRRGGVKREERASLMKPQRPALDLLCVLSSGLHKNIGN